MTIHEKYMHRCLELAQKGAGYVAPNPMVGAVLVKRDRIIGEGWHEAYGGAHAEVNALADFNDDGADCTLYVSLEPCAHFGKTPPCADLVILKRISKVVIGCRDPFEAVNGKGIEKLRMAGIDVIEGVLEKECLELNKRFFTFHEKKRPFILLKWAQSLDGYIANSISRGNKLSERLLITNLITNHLVHQWRSEEASILVGTNTAFSDDPELTNRLMPGPSPIRMVVDMGLRLPANIRLFNRKQRTLVFNSLKSEDNENLFYYRLDKNKSLISQLMPALYDLKIQSVLVEGGTKLLQTFIDEDCWDEVRVLTNSQLVTGEGVRAPILTKGTFKCSTSLDQDRISFLLNN